MIVPFMIVGITFLAVTLITLWFCDCLYEKKYLAFSLIFSIGASIAISNTNTIVSTIFTMLILGSLAFMTTKNNITSLTN